MIEVCVLCGVSVGTLCVGGGILRVGGDVLGVGGDVGNGILGLV